MNFHLCIKGRFWPAKLQLFLMMKLAMLLTVVATMQVSAATYAQRVTLKATDISLASAIEQVKAQTGYGFFLKGKQVANERISVNIRNADLPTAMNLLLDGLQLSWVLEDETIIIQRKPRQALPPTAEVAAQQRTVSGRVTDPSGSALQGVTVTVKGTNTQAMTDNGGKFQLLLPADAESLVFTIVGFQRHEVPVTAESAINVVLKPAIADLEEVVVVGYGTVRKGDVTGAISSVSAAEIAEVPVANVSQALQGRAPGVLVTTASNHPGAEPTVRIRGNRSFSAGNTPLYVIDGMPMSGSLADINPNDIASMEILKDASATAIYGSRGANGVVLITTKRGKAGKSTISYDMYAGVTEAMGKIDMMNGEEFAEYKRESRRAVGRYDDDNPQADETLFEAVELESIALGRWTDYQSLLAQNGLTQNHQIGVTGGSEKTQFNISFNYYKDRGIIPQQDFSRYTSRINLDHRIGERIKVGMSSLGSYNLRNGADLNPYVDALRNNPLGVPYDEHGELLFRTLVGESISYNPLLEVQPGNYVNNRKIFRLFNSLYGEVHILDGLSYRLNFGPDLIQQRQGDFQAPTTKARVLGTSAAQGSESFSFNYTLENIINWKTLFDNHQLDVTGLFSVQTQQEEATGISVTGLPVDMMRQYNFGAAEIIESTSSSFVKQSILSYMGRINYNYDNRFLITLTGRLDGSSRFAKNHKWGFFPSAAASWNIANESFFQDVEAIDQLKLRLSYGQIGNTGIEPYRTMGRLSRSSYVFGDTPAFGYYPSTIRNDDLKWETTTSLNVGVDFSLLKGRISGNVEFYQQNTRDLLMLRQLPYTSGFTSILSNVGATRNKGFELLLGGTLVQGKQTGAFEWQADVNLFSNTEEIVELFNGKQDDIGNGWFIGHPITVYYDYEKIGIWQLGEEEEAASFGNMVGQIRVRDRNSDGNVTSADRTIIGDPRPSLSGGMTQRFRYRGVDLSVFLFANLGSTIRSVFHQSHNLLAGRYNNLDVDYWTPDNPTHAYPRPYQDQETPLYGSTLAFFDGSFVKVRSINLGYTLPGKWIAPLRAESIYIYANAQNPFVFSSYVQKEKGIDPEYVAANTPASRMFAVGLNVKF